MIAPNELNPKNIKNCTVNFLGVKSLSSKVHHLFKTKLDVIENTIPTTLACKYQKSIVPLKNKNVINKYRFNYYSPQVIQRIGVQILESLHILSNTKNIDTLKGRFEFVENLYDDFVKSLYP